MATFNKKKRIAGYLSAWASELGMAIQTIQRKLSKHNIDFEAGDEIPAREVFRALYDAREEALTRQALAEAEAAERENKEADKLLVDMSVAEKEVWQRILQPLKVEIDLIADKVAALANPDSPDHAHKVLTDWAEQVKQQIKDCESKPLTKKKKLK